MIPFTRPTIDEATIQGVVEVLRSGWITTGPKVLEFESALAGYFGADRHVRVMNSATAALEIALQVAGVKQGCEVIVPALSFAATANVIARLGARPVFVDVDIDTRNLDLEQVRDKIGPRTKALLPVHFGGLPVDMDRLYDIALSAGMRVVEDAAHAIGSRWRGRLIGSFGDLVCFSFHANKNLTTIEGGAVVTGKQTELFDIEAHRFHGIRRTGPDVYDVVFPGGKANMTDVAARIGLGQLPHLEAFNRRRAELANAYFVALEGLPGLRLPARGDSGHSWHMFAPLLELDALSITRAEFIRRMAEQQVSIGVHYPAMHLFSCYRSPSNREGAFPNAERIGRSTITLPLFPGMSDEDHALVCAVLHSVLGEFRR